MEEVLIRSRMQTATACSLGALLVLCCRLCSCPVQQDTCDKSKEPKAKEPKLMAVALFSQAGHAVVDLASRKFVLFEPRLRDRKGTWGLLSAKMTAEEAAAIRDLASAPALRTFRPEASWFGTCKLPRNPVLFSFRWEDREVVFAFPPKQVRSSVPKWAQDIYQIMSAISAEQGELEWKYKQDASLISQVPMGDDRMNQLRNERGWAFLNALPQKRSGW